MMNKEDTINIYQLVSKLKHMFVADDAANRALEAYKRGELPYDEFEMNNEVVDMLWRELKENIDTFSKLSCTECKIHDVCDKSQKELNQFCSSFTAEYKKVPKSTMDNNANTCSVRKLTKSEIRLAYSNIKVATGIFTTDCVDTLVNAGFYYDIDEDFSWDDVPFIIVKDKKIHPCYSPRTFANHPHKEVDVSELLCIIIVEPELYEDNDYKDKNYCPFNFDDFNDIKGQLCDIVEFMKNKNPDMSVVINGCGVSVIPAVVPIYSPMEKELSTTYTDRTDYANVTIKG